MKIKIIEETSDGDFTVGKTYEVSYVSNNVAYAFDNREEIEAVYSYEFVWVK